MMRTKTTLILVMLLFGNIMIIGVVGSAIPTHYQIKGDFERITLIGGVSNITHGTKPVEHDDIHVVRAFVLYHWKEEGKNHFIFGYVDEGIVTFIEPYIFRGILSEKFICGVYLRSLE